MPTAHGRNVALTPHLAKFVDDLVESGTYNNASEVVRDGLREKPDTLEVVEILHGRMNLDAHLERLGKEGHHSSPSRNRSTSSEHSGRIASG